MLKRAEGGEGSPKDEEDEPKTSQRPKFSSYTIASLLESVKRSSSPQEDKVVVGEKEEKVEEEEEEEAKYRKSKIYALETFTPKTF